MRERAKIASNGTAAGREIIGALNELLETVESRKPLHSMFTVRTVEPPEDLRFYNARGQLARS